MTNILSDIKKNINSIKQKGSFAQNLTYVFGSKVIVILLTLLVTPIISRIYVPSDYGLFAILNILLMNLALIATLRMPMAIVIAQNRKKMVSVIQLCLALLFAFALIFQALMFIWGNSILALFNAEELSSFIPFMGVGIIIYGLLPILSNWAVKEKEFKKTSFIGISSTAISKSFIVSYGLLASGNSFGLIFGEFIQKIGAILFQTHFIFKKRITYIYARTSLSALKTTFKLNKHFALFLFPAGWINLLGEQVLPLFLSNQTELYILGAYNMANGLIRQPLNLISNSINPVFYEKANKYKNQEKDILPIQINLYKKLFYIGLIPFSLIYFVGDEIFSIFLGDNWELAGRVSRIMAFPMLLSMIYMSLSSLYIVQNRQRQMLIYQSIKLVVYLITLLIGKYLLSFTLMELLWLFFGVSFVVNIIGIASLFHNPIQATLKYTLTKVLVIFLLGTTIELLRYLIFD